MNQKLIETLAKVIIAAGWADKTLDSKERNNLKDLLFEFQHVLIEPEMLDRADDSALDSRLASILEMYTEAPIGAAERERLVNDLRETVESEEDKALILSALKRMVEADGEITNDEQVILNDIIAKIESVDTGILGDLGRLVRGAVQRRADTISNALNRENYFEDFLENNIYYAVRRRLDLGEAKLDIPEQDLRKLSAAGGMMARVAHTDGVVLEKETEKITSILQNQWGLSREAAAFVMEIAMSEVSSNFDYLRMSREFVELTRPEERANLLDVLFVVANADGKVSNDEIKEISNIADYLLLSDNRVNEAHSKITQK